MKPFEPQQLPIKGIPWESLIPLIGKANRALAYYDGALYGVTNPDVLLSPLTTQEAVLSSKIEGTQATLGEVLKFEAGEIPDEKERLHDIEEIMNYRRAMRHAEEELKTRPFSLNLLKNLHSILLDGVRGEDKGRGYFRPVQNWIGPHGSKFEEAVFVPPAPMFLMDHLDNWEKYYHTDRPDPLVQLAIIHAQFEIIHPFLDGNGRLGRMIVPLFLFERKLLTSPMFYISAYLEAHKDQYVAKLRGLNEKTPESWALWIAFFLEALESQAIENASKAKAIIDLYERLKKQVIGLTHSQFAVPMLDLIFDQPVFRSGMFEEKHGMPSKPMIHNLLSQMRTAGVLKVVREGGGRRPQILALSELINLCEGKAVI